MLAGIVFEPYRGPEFEIGLLRYSRLFGMGWGGGVVSKIQVD